MKTFPLKLDDELHKKVRHAAIEDETSVHSWILDAIVEKLKFKKIYIQNKQKASGAE